MNYGGILDAMIGTCRVAARILPASLRERLRWGLHDRLCVGGSDTLLYDEMLVEALGPRAPSKAAIRDHLCTLFSDVVVHEPSLIVELGTRGGESTRAILAAATHSDALVLSLDLSPRPELTLHARLEERWRFVQSDDIEFGKSGFGPWCDAQGVAPRIDVLFIDSSHVYEHTVAEIETWFPYLTDDAVVLFHDTHMAEEYRRLNNSLAVGWDNERGVIRAVEEYLGKPLDETKVFADVRGGWVVRHYPYSSGLLYMKRLRGTSTKTSDAG